MAKKTIKVNGTTWKGTAKDDKVYIKGADYVSVNTGKGDDSIKNNYNYAWWSTIDAGKGNDTISLDTARQSSINAGAGNDKISLSGGSYLTINGGKGNDTVHASANYNLYQYASGDGNDVIYNLDSTDTLSITGGTYTKTTSGSDVILTVGKGKITLVGAKGQTLNIEGTFASGGKDIDNSTSNKKLKGTKYADTIKNYANYVTIVGGKNNDSIHNRGGNISISAGTGKDFIATSTGKDVTVDCGSGNDTVHNWSEKALIKGGSGNDDIMNGSNVQADYSTVDGGAGDDTIDNFSNFSSIFGGKGNDFISNGGYYDCNNSTIKGGTGNDTVSLNSGSGYNVIQYASGDGKDVIYNLGATDTLQITGAKYTKKTSGNDVILTVGKGKITLKDAKGKTLNINGTLKGGASPVVIPSDAFTYNGHSYYIYSDASTWEAAEAYCEARGGHLAVINNAAENTALYNYMRSKDYGAAFFGLSDAAKEGTWTWINGDKVSYTNWGSVEPNGGTYENYGMFYYDYTNGEWNDGDFNADAIFICEWDTVAGSTSTVAPDPTVPAGDVLNGTNGHDNLKNGTSWNSSTGAGKVIYGYDGNDTIENYADNVYISGGKGNDYIKSYYGSNSTVLGGAGADNITVQSNNGFVSGDDGNDTITAYKGTHLTLSGGAGNDYLWGGVNSDTLIGGSGDDTFVYKPGEGTDHITDFSGGDMLKILKSNGSEGGTFTSATYSGGNLTLAISGGGSVILDNVSSGQSININGTNYKISGGTLK